MALCNCTAILARSPPLQICLKAIYSKSGLSIAVPFNSAHSAPHWTSLAIACNGVPPLFIPFSLSLYFFMFYSVVTNITSGPLFYFPFVCMYDFDKYVCMRVRVFLSVCAPRIRYKDRHNNLKHSVVQPTFMTCFCQDESQRYTTVQIMISGEIIDVI